MIKNILIEISLNHINYEWWIDLGISYSRTQFMKQKHVITISLLFISLYIRW